jgi:ComF family protein
MIRDFISLFYPNVCAACSTSLHKHEQNICDKCYINLPRSNFHSDQKNPVNRLFHGRVDILMAGSYYLFTKAGSVQKILHQLKYRGNTEVGITLGRWYGEDLRSSEQFASADLVIPVPLHAKRLKKRGYNQSACFAQGLSESMRIEMKENVLIRKDETKTQTQKSRYDRWQNVENKFEVKEPEGIYNKHVLLVDDVVTTGATLEACAQELKKVQGVKVSIATIAYAQQV